MRLIYSSLVIVLYLGLAGCSGNPAPAPIVKIVSAPTTAPVDINAEYRLDSGDKLRIRVFGENQMSGEYDVGGNGDVGFPLIGNVQARGKTVHEFLDALKDKLKQGYLVDPQVTVDVLNYRPFYILGEVKQPGSYAYVSGMNVVNAVALAGGYTYRAKEELALIKRAKNPNVEEKASSQSQVLPGDVITIPERYF
jgi:protein involved in polysaccharide export with SLBB domain